MAKTKPIAAAGIGALHGLGDIAASALSLAEQFGVTVDPEIIAAQKKLAEQLGFGPQSGVTAFSAATESTESSQNIVGLAIGEKLEGEMGSPTGRPSIRVYVRQKVADPSAIASSFVERFVQFGGRDYETDVIETGPISLFGDDYRVKKRPADCGQSIGPEFPGRGTGTLGYVCIADGKRCILSNNHVMANNNQLTAGEQNGVYILQPGDADFGVSPADRMGRLLKFVPLKSGVWNRVDAALAWTDAMYTTGKTVSGFPMKHNPISPSARMKVRKDGRTTGFTRGEIVAINAQVQTEEGFFFDNQIQISGIGATFSNKGDSGSGIVCDTPGPTDGCPVGLLFAGNAAHNVTFANPILDVMSALAITSFVV